MLLYLLVHPILTPILADRTKVEDRTTFDYANN